MTDPTQTTATNIGDVFDDTAPVTPLSPKRFTNKITEQIRTRSRSRRDSISQTVELTEKAHLIKIMQLYEKEWIAGAQRNLARSQLEFVDSVYKLFGESPELYTEEQQTNFRKLYLARLQKEKELTMGDYKRNLESREQIVIGEELVDLTQELREQFIQNYNEKISLIIDEHYVNFQVPKMAMNELEKLKDDVEARFKRLEQNANDIVEAKMGISVEMEAVKTRANRALTEEEKIENTHMQHIKNALLAKAEDGNLAELKEIFKPKKIFIGKRKEREQLALKVNAKYDGYHLLHAACANGHVELARFLIKRGANPKLLDSEGKSALHYARESEDFMLADPRLASLEPPKRKSLFSFSLFSLFRQCFGRGKMQSSFQAAPNSAMLETEASSASDEQDGASAEHHATIMRI